MTDYEKGFTDALLKVLDILEGERLDPLEHAYDAYELDAIKQSNAALDKWHNFKTGETDYLSQGASLNFDDEQAKRYIEQSVATQGYYKCLRELGLSVFEAMLNTLNVSAGEPIKYELPEDVSAPHASDGDAADTGE